MNPAPVSTLPRSFWWRFRSLLRLWAFIASPIRWRMIRFGSNGMPWWRSTWRSTMSTGTRNMSRFPAGTSFTVVQVCSELHWLTISMFFDEGDWRGERPETSQVVSRISSINSRSQQNYFSQVSSLHHFCQNPGFAIITWNNPKQLEKPQKSPRDKRYLSMFFGGRLIFWCNFRWLWWM